MPPTSPNISEYRIVLPMTVDEYHVAQLWSVAEASKNETGGGEGIEVRSNEPFDSSKHTPSPPLDPKGEKYTEGQYTYKIYHLESRVPRYIRAIAPKGSLEIHEEAWNAYPYCRTIVTNPGYMKDGFYIKIETFHADDRGNSENIHGLQQDDLGIRKIVNIDISDNVKSADYKQEWDPVKFKSEKTGRGPLVQGQWKDDCEPVMCAYKLVSCKFKWFGLQNRVEKFIQTQEKRIFTNFHRQVFCWMDKWHGLTMEDIRRLEEQTKNELDKARGVGKIRGTTGDDEDEKESVKGKK